MPISNFQLLLGFSGFLALLMSFTLLVLRRSYPRTIRGLDNWSYGALAWSMGFFLLIGRGSLPDFLAYVISNTLIAFGFTFFLLGLTKFAESKKNPVVPILMSLNVGLFFYFVWFAQIQPAFLPRAWAMIAIVLINLFCIFSILIRKYRKSFGWNYMLFVFGFIITIWIIRAFALSQGKLVQDFHETPSLISLFMIVTAPIAAAMGLLGCIILASENLHKQLENKSRFDSLTNCLARASILEEIQKEILRSVRQKSNFALMMMDLDNFKIVNDTLGHAHGDRILVDFSNCVTEVIRQIDRLGRLGGDEFVLLLPDTTEAAARSVAERIYAAGNRGDHLSWQVSIGIAVWNGQTDNLEQLMERADKALYLEKSKDKNKIAN
jgi:diguanylate cyclase (GGDEF)-like protein